MIISLFVARKSCRTPWQRPTVCLRRMRGRWEATHETMNGLMDGMMDGDAEGGRDGEEGEEIVHGVGQVIDNTRCTKLRCAGTLAPVAAIAATTVGLLTRRKSCDRRRPLLASTA